MQNSSYLLERNIKTISGNNIAIKSNNSLAKKHFDDTINYTDVIINQINNDNIYEKYINKQNNIILDIGANIGIFSLHCSDAANVIYSFEPTPCHFDLLQEFTKNHENIIPINMAISNSDGEIDFFMSEDNTTMNSIINQYSNKIKVKCTSILTFLKENNIDTVDFIKCDIEGSEMIALNDDIVQPLYSIVKKWFIEVHNTPYGDINTNRNKLRHIFENAGYICEYIQHDTLYVHI